MIDQADERRDEISRDETLTDAESVEDSVYVSGLDLYLPSSTSHADCRQTKCCVASSVSRGARLNERSKKRHRQVSFYEIVKDPLKALTFVFHEVMANSMTLLLFSITLSLPFIMNASVSGNSMVTPEQGSESEITAEIIANAIPSPPRGPAPPTDLKAFQEVETNAPTPPPPATSFPGGMPPFMRRR
jgi:hypothetical protein